MLRTNATHPAEFEDFDGNDQSINQSKHISIAPYVASESEARAMMTVMTELGRQTPQPAGQNKPSVKKLKKRSKPNHRTFSCLPHLFLRHRIHSLRAAFRTIQSTTTRETTRMMQEATKTTTMTVSSRLSLIGGNVDKRPDLSKSV